METMRNGFGLMAIAGLVPQVALACPACAGRGGFNIHTALVLGSMILVPFLIAGAVVQIVRRLESENQP
jgi:hypothetical protein